MYLKYCRKKTLEFLKKIELRDKEDKFYTFTDKNQKICLQGNFYYYSSDKLKSVFFNNNPKQQLKRLLKKYNLNSFINNVEGEYWGAKIDYKNKTLTIFSDKLKQLELYYFWNDDIFLVSEDPKKIIDEVGILGYEKNSLISSILLYVPKGHTIFKGIYRLKYNEIITITQNKISINNLIDKDTGISKYSENDLLQYNKILKNAVLSRASKNFNLVLISGGWDSTLILSILRKHLGKNKVKGIIMSIILSDGRCFNKFEVEKSKKIGKNLGVKTDIIEVDYRKKDVSEKFKEAKDELFLKNLFLLTSANWSMVISYINQKYGKDVVIFDGEGADSLHNYGFSQYISLLHENDNFREYADKMRNYLFGPTFFKKIKNDNFLGDIVYKIFLNFNKDKKFVNVENFNNEKKLYYYLMSFIFSDLRIPFREVDCKRYVRNTAFKNFEEWLRKEYFQKVIDNIQEKNLYYNFSYLYILFHLQSPQIRIFRSGLENVRFPYIDSNLFRFLYKMPESFGRGLNFNSVKFPLKKLARNVLSGALLEILESGPHSYLSEIEDINFYDEYLLKGPGYKYMRDKIDYKKVKNIFDNKNFYINEIENLIKRFKKGELKNISGIEARLLILLILLSSHSF